MTYLLSALVIAVCIYISASPTVLLLKSISRQRLFKISWLKILSHHRVELITIIISGVCLLSAAHFQHPSNLFFTLIVCVVTRVIIEAQHKGERRLAL